MQVAAEAIHPEEQLDFIDMAAKGGIIMYPLYALSFVAVFIFAERFAAIRRALRIDENFMHSIREHIVENRSDAAISLCQSQSTPIARMIEKGVKRIGRPLSDIQSTVENVGNVEIARLEKGLSMLATVAGGAPMLGFLGTVTGMIRAFFNMEHAGNNLDISLLSGGISEAMVTTVGGLIVGIIAYFGYNYLTSRISAVVHKLETTTIEFMDILYYQNEKTVAPQPQPKKTASRKKEE
ncbi:biopolymer transporter ExbB [Bacteroidia bacterium]|nr:biopolymer transporter ExbB [Bacteroidia bacterium]